MNQDRNFKAKQNRIPQNNSQNQSNKSKDHFNTLSQYDIDLSLKPTTKLSSFRTQKHQQILMDKTCQILPGLQKKSVQPQRKSMMQTQNNGIRKFNIKKKTDKRKPLQEQLKPQPQKLIRYEQYINFLKYVNISNNLKITCQQFQKPYVLYVGKGNNGILIKNMFKTYRPWWILQQQPTNKQINLHWYQLKQNNILEDFKQVNNFDDFDKFQYYAEKGENQEKNLEDKSRSQSRSHIRSSTQRSLSLMAKDSSSFMKKRLDTQNSRRDSSASKNGQKSIEKVSKLSPSVKNHNFKQLKLEGIENEMGQTQKRLLANPKMWPIYFMYRKIFSATDIKAIKKMGIIKEDGKIQGKLLRFKMRSIENRSNYIKMHNHLQNNWNLSNKKALFVNIKNYFQAQKVNPFDYIPITFHVQKIGDKQYQSFVQQYQKRCQQISNDQKNNKKSQYKSVFKPKKRNAWLVKPGQNTNRGIGIEVVESLQQIKQIIAKDNIDSQGRPRTHIIQQYIMPFLYQKRKFDIRCYILITSVNGMQKGYWYQDGYIRTACKQFNMKNLANRMIHLTNDAVQKKCEDYGKYQPGNKLSFSDFQRYLDTNFNNVQNGPKLKFFQQAYPEMKKLATDAIRSVYSKIDPKKKQFSFQIFGLDFLIDQNFKVWLIQANTNPCLQLSSPLLGRIIPSMLQNAFKVAIDPIFPPPPLNQLFKNSTKISMPQNAIQNNKFQLVFDQIQQRQQLKTLLTNAPDVHIYNIQQEQQEYVDSDRQNCVDE